jgi:hypothetical protein
MANASVRTREGWTMSGEYPPPGPGPEPEDSPYQPPPQPAPPPAPSGPQWNPQSPGTPVPGSGGQPGYDQSPYVQPPAAPGYGGFVGYGAPVQTAPLAIVSLVLGILGFPCCLFFVLGIAAVVTGFVARKQIDDSRGAVKGGGMAMAGIVLGVIAIVTGVVVRILQFAGTY